MNSERLACYINQFTNLVYITILSIPGKKKELDEDAVIPGCRGN